jgi:hypothetical protein
MEESQEVVTGAGRRGWITRSVVGIVLATFFSDVGHEMVTAALPLYLASVGLGAAALGVMEGLPDFLFSVAKLAGGRIGHHTERKRLWGTLGYTTTTISTVTLALVQSVPALVTLRGVAWFGRGFRSPLRDFLLSDEVGPTHFGRAYGVERAADMMGAVIGPLVAATLVWAGIDFRWVILFSIVPSAISVASFFSMTRDRRSPPGVYAALPHGARSRLVGESLRGHRYGDRRALRAEAAAPRPGARVAGAGRAVRAGRHRESLGGRGTVRATKVDAAAEDRR